jgi:exosortase/archaeosortase family protein
MLRDLVRNKYVIWAEHSLILLILYFCGLLLPKSVNFVYFVIDLSFVIILFSVQVILALNSLPNSPSLKKRILNSIYHSLNSFYAFTIGLSIPFMVSSSRFNAALLLIPLLIFLSYIITDKPYREQLQFDKQEFGDRPVIEFQNKKYVFSTNSIFILAIGAPLVAFFTFLFFDTPINFWLHETVVKQTVFFLNLFFNMHAQAVYSPVGKYYWSFSIPGRASIYFETFCTGIQAINIFLGVILCTPHSLDKNTNKDIWWRKAKSLIISSAIFYFVNIIRMLIQIYLYYIGYSWDSIHVSISAASSFIAVIIVLLLHKWIPEFILSIIYAGTLIRKKILKFRKIESKNSNPN